MSLSSDIAATYLRPRRVMQRHLAIGPREDRALMYLILSCVLIFLAQWPRLGRQSHFDESVPFDALIGGALLGWLFIAPLGLYGLAALSHLLARAVGGNGSWYGARLALFWALLAATPLWLLNGLAVGVIGSGAARGLTGLVALAAFLIFWGLSLLEAESPEAPA